MSVRDMTSTPNGGSARSHPASLTQAVRLVRSSAQLTTVCLCIAAVRVNVRFCRDEVQFTDVAIQSWAFCARRADNGRDCQEAHAGRGITSCGSRGSAAAARALTCRPLARDSGRTRWPTCLITGAIR